MAMFTVSKTAEAPDNADPASANTIDLMNPSVESRTTSKVEQTVKQQTQAGNYFVSNYPPYSFWKPSFVDQYQEATERHPLPDTPLGLYFHVPFCRKRCHFCYFKVYTKIEAEL